MLPKLVGGVYSSTSEKELERRKLAVQEVMAKKGADCVILAAHNADVGGAIKYFTDIHVSPYGAYVLMPRDGDLTYYGHGAEGTKASNSPYSKNFEGNIAFPYMVAFSFTDSYIPTEIVKWINSRGYKRIGLYRKQHISMLIGDAIREGVPGFEFVSMDDEIDLIQAVKSEEEIGYLEHVVKLHDDLIVACNAFIRPGRFEREVANDVMKLSLDNNCELLNIMVGSGRPIGRYKTVHAANKRIEAGDIVDILVEVSGPGGYWGEVSRMWCLGEPPPGLMGAFADCLEIQERIASLARPGARACDLMTELHSFQVAHGYDKELRLFAHGQGYDVVSRPCFMPGDTMEIQENMFFAIHPILINANVCAHITDNFLITKDGGKLLSKTPRQVFLIDC